MWTLQIGGHLPRKYSKLEMNCHPLSPPSPLPVSPTLSLSQLKLAKKKKASPLQLETPLPCLSQEAVDIREDPDLAAQTLPAQLGPQEESL